MTTYFTVKLVNKLKKQCVWINKPTLFRFKMTQQPSWSSTHDHFLYGTFAPFNITTHSQSCILYIHHQSSVPGNPKMMSELVSLFHSDLHPVVLVLQFLKKQHKSTSTQMARTHYCFRPDEFLSPWHLHEAPQMCHWVCPFINTQHTWRKLSPSLPDNTMECLSRNTIHS